MLAASFVAVSTLFLGASALTPNNVPTPSTSGALTALKYRNVGGIIDFQRVTDMIPGEWPSCTIPQPCVREPVTVSGTYSTSHSKTRFVLHLFKPSLTLFVLNRLTCAI